eukprot:12426391-Karenia_brevis.AAC.1
MMMMMMTVMMIMLMTVVSLMLMRMSMTVVAAIRTMLTIFRMTKMGCPHGGYRVLVFRNWRIPATIPHAIDPEAMRKQRGSNAEATKKQLGSNLEAMP